MIRLQSRLARYGFAAAATLVLSFVDAVSGSVGIPSDLRYFAFAVVVIAAAVLGGFGPGALATCLAALVNALLFLAPTLSLQFASRERVGVLVLFLADGILLSLIGGVVRDARTADIEASWQRWYLTPLLFVSAATGVKWLLFRDLERELPFTFMYAAVAGSAWAGGFGAGIAATILSGFAARYFFLDPLYSISISSRTNILRVLLFIVEGAAISYLAGKHLEARAIVRVALTHLRRFDEKLDEGARHLQALKTVCGDSIWELQLSPSKATPVAGGQDGESASNTMDFSGWLQQVHPKDRLSAMASLRSALEQGRTEWFYQYRRRRPGKGYVHVSDHAYIMRDEAWNPIRVIARSAEHESIRRALSGVESEGPYRAFFENNPDAILLADTGWRILEANDAACDLLGYSRTQLEKMDVESLFEARKRGAVMHLLVGLDAEDNSSKVFEEDCLDADGGVFRAKITAAVISPVEGSVVSRMITVQDISDVEVNH